MQLKYALRLLATGLFVLLMSGCASPTVQEAYVSPPVYRAWDYNAYPNYGYRSWNYRTGVVYGGRAEWNYGYGYRNSMGWHR